MADSGAAVTSPATGPALAVQRARDGDVRALGRLLTWVENGAPELRQVLAAAAPLTGQARVLGLTGAPGVGKSTLSGALVAAYRQRGLRVGVLAVDPSSPFTGGALLGDRVRMTAHTTDPGVYIRSLASRGHLGGLSWATPQALRVLDAAGYDVVIVETVGVGQAEVEIASLADTTLVLLAPGMGDGIQAAKAGILEIADVLVVNKADRPGADDTYRDLTAMIRLSDATGFHRDAGRAAAVGAAATGGAATGGAATGGDAKGREAAAAAGGRWVPKVVRTVAAEGTGVGEVVDAVAAHRAWLVASGELARRRAGRVADEIEQIALAGLRARFGDARAHVGGLAEQVVAGRLDPWTAADDLIATLTGRSGATE